jgi:hypothetical protein
MELVACCASHATMPRLPRILKCLKSIAGQHVPVRTYWIWSAENKETADRVEQELKQIPVIISSFSQKKLSQFEHYQRAELLLPQNTFVLFSDDDDVWSDRRTAEYSKALKGIGELGKVMSAIRCPLAKHGSDIKECDEYWTLCVNKQVMSDFFNHVSSKVVSSPLCDLAFYRYVLTYKPTLWSHIKIVDVGPLYFYDADSRGVVWGMHNDDNKHYLEDKVIHLLKSNKRLDAAVKVLRVMCDSPKFLNTIINNTEMSIFRNRSAVYWKSSNNFSERYQALWDLNFKYVTSVMRNWMEVQLDWNI